MTFLLLSLYNVIQGIFPFGEYTFLRKDLYHQYLPFLAEFRRRLTEGSGLRYSFRLGLGAPFYPLYVYYLSDPFNYLSVLIPEEHLLEYMTFVAYIKMSLAASFMCRYLRYKGKNERIVYAVILGVCYGMSGFMAAYDWNVMWLWGIALAPLVLMGAEKIANGESALLYTLTMTLTVMTNYYIAMVVGIFLIPYFITVSIDNFKGIKNTFRSWITLFFSTILSAALSAFLLLPEAAAIKETSFAGIDMPDTLEFYMSIPTLMMRSLAAVGVETGLTHEPNIYASLPVLAFAFLFFVNGKFSIAQKICRGLLIIFMYLSFDTNILEYIWHGLNYPDSLPARQGFLFVIVLITTAYEGLDGADRMGARRLALPLIMPVLFLVSCMIFAGDDSHIKEHTWLINAVFIVLYLGFFIFRIVFRSVYTRRGIYAFAMILMTELLLNFNVTSSRDISREGYFAHVESFAALRDMAEADNKLNQGHFTRFDAVEESIRNDACLTGYKGDAFFSSTINS
ncbi:MAG: YfhO family protein, partial [Oscillospiraceae bacterium]|nr:YfhO family protein [Oscillospiraceae bacterium]